MTERPYIPPLLSVDVNSEGKIVVGDSPEFSAFTGNLPEGHFVPPTDPQNDSQFVSDLTQLLNRYSRENESNTPDFILCQFLIDSLASLNKVVQQRDSWYGVNLYPGHRASFSQLEGESQIGYGPGE